MFPVKPERSAPRWIVAPSGVRLAMHGLEESFPHGRYGKLTVDDPGVRHLQPVPRELKMED